MFARALLIGVSEYESDAIQDLEFIANDLGSLNGALTNIGYDVTLLGGPGKRAPTHNSIIHGINNFCRNEVQNGELAFIYFSGHGLHYQGQDYLVPSDASLGDEILEQVMVPLDFAAIYENSAASTVLFFVDACREGVDLGEKSGLGYQRWTEGKLEAVRDQQAAHIFACGPGEVSRYIGGPDGFSLFSRALADVLGEPRSALPMNFGRLRHEVQKRLDELCDQYRKARQNIRVVSESGASERSLSAIQVSAGGMSVGAAASSQPTIDVEAIGELTVSRDDLKLMSYSQNAEPPWLGGDVPIIHLLRCAAALDRPLPSVINRLREFEPVGIRVPDVDLDVAAEMELDRNDLVLLPSGELQSPRSEEISAIQVLYAANRLRQPVDVILRRLQRFEVIGIRLPEIDPDLVQGLMVDERDLTILSTDLDQRDPWLEGEVPVSHILRVASYLEEPVGRVVGRLEHFEPCGIYVSLESSSYINNFVVEDAELRLLSETLDPGGPWVEPLIPIGHIMYVSQREEQTIGRVIDRLLQFKPFGYRVPEVEDAVASLKVPKEDLLLISRDFDGIAPWLSGEIPATRVLVAANSFDETVGQVCERIQRYQGTGLAHAAISAEGAKLRITGEDVLFLSGGKDVPTRYLMYNILPIGHVLYAAHKFDEGVDEAAARARRLEAGGITVPAIEIKESKGVRVADKDLKVLSANLDGEQPWVRPEVDWFHLVRAANALREPLNAVVERMKRFAFTGYSIPKIDEKKVDGLEVTREDVILLSEDLDGYQPGIDLGPIETVHLMQASSAVELTLGAVADRLERFKPLGIVVPNIPAEARGVKVDRSDMAIFSEDLDGIEPWINEKIPLGHLLFAASQRNEEVGKTITNFHKFESLGFVLPSVDHRGKKLRVSPEDVMVMSTDLDGRPPWVEGQIPVIHLLQAASRLEEPVKETFDRLRRLETLGAASLVPFFGSIQGGRRSRRRAPF